MQAPHPKPLRNKSVCRSWGAGATASEQLPIREGPSESGKQEGHYLCSTVKRTEAEGRAGEVPSQFP